MMCRTMWAAYQRRRGIALGFVLVGLFLTCLAPAVALDPALDVSQYAHTSWKVRDGFVPGVIFAIAQTPDGYLWLGTEFGLYRFDGVRAVAWQPPAGQQLPSSDILRLMVSRDGTLWIGTRKGLARWKDGRLTRYPEIAERGIGALLEDHEGTIWIGEWQVPQGKLCAIRKGAVECYGTDGSLGYGALSLFEDSAGSLWVGGGAPPKFGSWHWRPDQPRFYPKAFGQSFAEDSEGGLLVGGPQGLMRLVDGKLEARPDALPRSMRGLIVYSLQRDREGSLWAGVSGGGLAHVHRDRTDVFTQSDGLSGNIITALFEDREGSMWVATNDGLDRFRNFAISTWSARQGLPYWVGAAVLAGNDGTIWMGAVGSLAKLHEGEVTVYRQRPETGAPTASRGVHEKIDRGLPERFFALLQDHNGRLWISSPDGLGYLEGEQFHAIPPFGTRVIYSLAEDPTGDLWVQDQENGLFRVHDGKVNQHIPWEMLGHKDNGRSLAVDRVRGGLWIGFSTGGVVYLKDGQVRASYSPSDLGGGPVADLRFGSRGTLWAATEGGLSRIRDGRVTTLTSKDGLPCDTVHWSIEDNEHFSWLYMTCGLVRIARSELDAWVSDPKHKVQAAVFDISDGVRTVVQFAGFHPQASKAPDGRIWFGGMDGVGVIDQRHLPRNDVPPPVHVEQINADHKVYDTSAGVDGHLRLPPLLYDLQIDYTALSLAVPEKVRFRYKLEGFDRDWQEAGNRRQAFYTNLRPGKYRFRVAACNNSGLWNEAGAAFDFSIAPAYYQTRWFQLLCVLAAILLGWALYRLRVRRLANAMSARFDERLAERNRVARELHDTLLQTVQGSKFVVDGVLMDPSNDPAPPIRRVLEKLSGSLDLATQEARGAVNSLRASTIHKNDLAAALRDAMDDCRGDTSMETSLHLSGNTKDMHPVAREEVYRIGYEAVRNACTHSQAKRLEVNLTYGRDLTLRVSDNGVGIAPVVADKGRDGHFGLHGMRERAARIGAKFTLVSSQGSGTKILLVVPGSHIFRKPGASPLEKIREVLKGLDRPSSPK